MNPIKGVLGQSKKALADANKIKVSDNYLITKVAWGEFYRVDNDPYGDLWILSKESDNDTYLVRTKYLDDNNVNIGKVSGWDLVTNSGRDLITLSYKNVPIYSFDKESYGFDDSSVYLFKASVLDLLKNNKEAFLNSALKSQTEDGLKLVSSYCPELLKYMEKQ